MFTVGARVARGSGHRESGPEAQRSTKTAMERHRSRSPGRVVICGGGVAAVEALLALRSFLEVGVDVHLVAPSPQFVYRPLSVAAPFDLVETRVFDLAEIAGDHSAELHLDSLASVDGDERRVRLASGKVLAYDFLVIAVGARRRDWLHGAVHFGGEADVAAFRDLLERLQGGLDDRLCFVNPTNTSWTLPLYELALLTASHLASRGVIGVELTVVTPEADPLAVFGPAASRMLRNLLANRGIALKAGARVEKIQRGTLYLDPSATLDADHVVALAELEGPALPGLPSDASGFIAVDEHSRVAGLKDVYAAGDGTTFPIKQGGLATQQADGVAEAIAAQLGAAVTTSPVRPTLRGVLLTGIAPVYLRAEIPGAGELSETAVNPLWWPPSKIAGRYLAPYLASHNPLARGETLQDRPASTADPATLEESHDEARELALTFAERDAQDGHFTSALKWLDVLEQIDGVLPPEYVRKRVAWQDHADPVSHGAITPSSP
jgi:sulfide:quinone oxidoreductase